MSSSENLNERINTIISTQDPSIVDDLRHHNRGHPTKYERFWEECRKYLEDETAVDDRRHGEHTHLAKAISARDLLEEVSKRCPEGTAIPSKQWLRLQFWPKKPHEQDCSSVHWQVKCKVYGPTPSAPKES